MPISEANFTVPFTVLVQHRGLPLPNPSFPVESTTGRIGFLCFQRNEKLRVVFFPLLDSPSCLRPSPRAHTRWIRKSRGWADIQPGTEVTVCHLSLSWFPREFIFMARGRDWLVAFSLREGQLLFKKNFPKGSCCPLYIVCSLRVSWFGCVVHSVGIFGDGLTFKSWD